MKPSNVDTVIFDVDGVLVDSEKISCGALQITLMDEFSISTGSDFSPVLGTSDTFAIKYYLTKNEIRFDEDIITKIKSRKLEKYFELAEQELNTFPQCQKFIEYLIEKDYKIAVASSGSLSKIKFSLQKVNLLHYFTNINSTEEVIRGKPFPDLFLKAAKSIKSRPEQCVVIEDSIMGIKAAKAAKMHVYGFIGSFTQQAIESENVPYFIQYNELFDKF